MPARINWNNNVQQGIRRLGNTRPRLHAVTRNQLMEEWAEVMMVSGHTENHRKEAIQCGDVGYERMVERDAKGQTPLYRSRIWNKEERRKKKLMKKIAWYRPQDTVIFVPTTPNGELAMNVRKVVQEEGRRINVKVTVVETAGTSLGQKLVRTDLAANKPCRQQDCLLCITGEGNSSTSHHRSGALYKGSCKLCEKNDLRAEYHGETGYSAYTRTQEHAEEMKKQDSNNAFAKHLAAVHPENKGNPECYRFQAENIYYKPLERQVAEAIGEDIDQTQTMS